MAEKLKKYEGRKESLSDLEQALVGLGSEVIKPILEAKAKCETTKNKYENKP